MERAISFTSSQQSEEEDLNSFGSDSIFSSYNARNPTSNPFLATQVSSPVYEELEEGGRSEENKDEVFSDGLSKSDDEEFDESKTRQIYDIRIKSSTTRVEEKLDNAESNSNLYTIYHVEVFYIQDENPDVPSKPKTVFRRFREFANLHHFLKQEFPKETFPVFPTKVPSYFSILTKHGNLVDDVIEDRKLKLNKYLVELKSTSTSVWSSFRMRLFLEDFDFLNKKTKNLCVITGGTGGIGEEVVKVLTILGWDIILGVRDVTSGKRFVEKLERENFIFLDNENKKEFNIHLLPLDLSSFESVTKFAEGVQQKFSNRRIKLIVNCAGAYVFDKHLSSDGFEMHFQVNYLSHFLLTNLLVPQLASRKASCDEHKKEKKHFHRSRVVNVVCDQSHLKHIDYTQIKPDTTNGSEPLAEKEVARLKKYFYQNSKLAMLTWSNELSIQLEKKGIDVNAVNPGEVPTNIWNTATGDGGWLLWGLKKWMTPVEEGGLRVLYAAISQEMEAVTGRYLEEMKEKKGNGAAYDRGEMRKLWEESEAWTKMQD